MIYIFYDDDDLEDYDKHEVKEYLLEDYYI